MSYRCANLQRCILYIYSTNIRTEYFKHAAHSPFFSSSKCRLFHNATFFGSCIIHILYTECAKIEKKNSGTKRLTSALVGGWVVKATGKSARAHGIERCVSPRPVRKGAENVAPTRV